MGNLQMTQSFSGKAETELEFPTECTVMQEGKMLPCVLACPYAQCKKGN